MKKEDLRIYLFRHGQTTYNRDSMFTGKIDSKLTKSGVNDAKIVALRLKNKKFNVAFHSSLSRSKDTLKEVLKFHPECTKIIEDDRIIERDYGNLSGKTHYDIVIKNGYEKYDLWHRSYDIRPPKGESFNDVEKRVKDFIKYLKKYMKENNCNVAISAHGNSIRLFRKIMENASKKEVVKWSIPYDNYYEYIIN